MNRSDFWFLIGVIDTGFYSVNHSPLWIFFGLVALVLSVYHTYRKPKSDD